MTFKKAIESISDQHNIVKVFDDFLMMSVCAFSLGQMEERYNEIIKSYSKDEIPLFGTALGAMVNEYEKAAQDGWQDVLGRFFETVNSDAAASRSGQFFTPESLCTLMAQMVGDDQPCKEGILVNDCSSGSSRNLIAHSRMHPRNRFNAMYVAQELDERGVNMSVLNFVMYGMRGVVIHMNTLSMEVYKGYRVYLPETGLGVQPLNKEQATAFLFENKEKEHVNVGGEQLKLF